PDDAHHVLTFELAAVGFADGGAVRPKRALDEETLAQKPGVVLLLAPESQPAGSVERDLLALVEDVLLELLPVVVAARDDVLHEGVEDGLRRRPRRRERRPH